MKLRIILSKPKKKKSWSAKQNWEEPDSKEDHWESTSPSEKQTEDNRDGTRERKKIGPGRSKTPDMEEVEKQ